MKEYFEILMDIFGIKSPKLFFSLAFILLSGVVAYDCTKYNKIFKYYPETTLEFTEAKDVRFHIDFYNSKFPRRDQDISYMLADNYLRIDLGFPENIILGYIDIPASSIQGCVQSSWQKQNYGTFILKETQTKLKVYDDNFTDWCWKNKLPNYRDKEISNWKYNDEPLPSIDSIRYRLTSKEAYTEEHKRICKK